MYRHALQAFLATLCFLARTPAPGQSEDGKSPPEEIPEAVSELVDLVMK